MAQAEGMLAKATDTFLILFLMLIIMFIVEIVSDFFQDIFGDYDKDTSLPIITII